MDLFKVIKNAMAKSGDLENMGSSLVQLLTGTLDIRGCTLFVSNPETRELEILSTFGLSPDYISKGAISSEKSIAAIYRQKPVMIQDTSTTDLLQYPEAAINEGIKAIISLPVIFNEKVIGALRLYNQESWKISDKDVETLMLFTDHVAWP